MTINEEYRGQRIITWSDAIDLMDSLHSELEAAQVRADRLQTEKTTLIKQTADLYHQVNGECPICVAKGLLPSKPYGCYAHSQAYDSEVVESRDAEIAVLEQEREAQKGAVSHWINQYAVAKADLAVAESRLTALRQRLAELEQQWRKQATADAKYGTSNATESAREYFGTVNAALMGAQCADDLTAARKECESRSPDGDGHARPSLEPQPACGQSLRDERAVQSEAGSEPADSHQILIAKLRALPRYATEGHDIRGEQAIRAVDLDRLLKDMEQS